MNTILKPTLQGYETAALLMRDGGVIAYPTEAVFGLGCDPFNRDAVSKLLRLKKRNPKKGLIIIASDFGQLRLLLDMQNLTSAQINEATLTWPGPQTWIFPASPKAPKWIRGDNETLAVRVTNHPIAKALCQVFGPLVSTSANIEGQPPARVGEEVLQQFPYGLSGVVDGKVGSQKNPTQIRDVRTGEILRKD